MKRNIVIICILVFIIYSSIYILSDLVKTNMKMEKNIENNSEQMYFMPSDLYIQSVAWDENMNLMVLGFKKDGLYIERYDVKTREVNVLSTTELLKSLIQYDMDPKQCNLLKQESKVKTICSKLNAISSETEFATDLIFFNTDNAEDFALYKIQKPVIFFQQCNGDLLFKEASSVLEGFYLVFDSQTTKVTKISELEKQSKCVKLEQKQDTTIVSLGEEFLAEIPLRDSFSQVIVSNDKHKFALVNRNGRVLLYLKQ